ncbi:cupin domain-containing protein [Oleiharenicola lentus]|uniref:cupin domain-containing protein n=1 Tax=Oleiharenicola lentus TaxID=2508720 RepID=UPI003F6680DD
METSPLNSTVFDWAKIVPFATKAGECRSFFDAPTRTLARLESHVSTVRAGEASHAPHAHADEELIIIKEGTLEVSINGVASTAGAGSMFFFASHDLHGMRNPGTVPASYYVIRIFPRDLTAS